MKTPIPHIVAKDVVKTVQLTESELTILQDIHLTINQGATVAIVGASGSGKSTLLGILAGLDQASSGEVYLAGQPLHQLTEDERAELRARSVGFVFQSFLLLPGLTALENVTLPAELAADKQAKQRGLALLQQVGLAERADFFPAQLSGGEQQRVAIARAFICEPKVLFADEPTGNLDSVNGHKIADMLFELNQESHTTLILVTHDLQLAKRCQRQLVMDNGHLQEELDSAQSHNVNDNLELSAKEA